MVYSSMAFLQKQKENRCLPRIDFNANIRYQIRGKPGFDNAVTKDISCGGLRFASDKFVSALTPIMLEVNILSRVLRPIARVVWSTPLPHSNRNQTGVEFIEFDMLESKYLKDFINMQLG